MEKPIKHHQKQISKKYIYSVNGLRGIASMGVLLSYPIESYYPKELMLGFFCHSFLFVDFFYLLTSFILGYAYDNYKNTLSFTQLIKRRLIRFEPMIVLSNFIGVMISRYLYAHSINYINFDKISTKTLVLNFILSIFNIPIPPYLRYCPSRSMFSIIQQQWSLVYEYIY